MALRGLSPGSGAARQACHELRLREATSDMAADLVNSCSSDNNNST